MDLKTLYQNVDEHPEEVRVKISGVIPEWLRGSYYKIGNGKFDLPSGFSFNHVFDGMSIVYQYNIKGDQVVFKSRFLDSDAYTKAMDAGKPIYTEFGTRSFPDPSKNFLARMFSSLVPGDLTDNDAANIFQFRGKLFVASETCFIRQVDPATLKSTRKVDLYKTVGMTFASSHFMEDRDGTTYNIGTTISTGIKHHVFKFPPTSLAEQNEPDFDPMQGASVLASVSSSWKGSFAYTHSFAMSEKYVVFIEQPYLANSLKLLASQVKGKALKDCLEWSPDEKTRFVVVEKFSGAVLKTKFVAPPIFFFHVVNAYEQDGHLVIDVNAHQTAAMIDKLYLDRLRNNEFDCSADPQQVLRYVLPIVEKTKELKVGENLVRLSSTTATAEKTKDEAILCNPEKIGPPGFEFPRINFKMCGGRKHRYVYGSGFLNEGFYRRAIGKVDVVTNEVKLWKAEESQCLSEPYFIPTPAATEEDDGIVVTTVVDASKPTEHLLLFIDASSFQEIARVQVPSNCALGNHALFIPTL